MSNDVIAAVYRTFGAYSVAFGKLDPDLIPQYFHLPAMLMTSKDVELMTDEDQVKAVFDELFKQLKHDDFKESKLKNLQISQVSENQAIVTGVATRHRKDGSIFEHCGLTYTLRNTDKVWKIIVGVLHDPNEFSATVPLKS